MSGGCYNKANAEYATIAGGGPSDPQNNPLITNNSVFDNYGTIGGGGNNTAGSDDGVRDNAIYATVPGGYGNRAGGAYSFAAGRRAIVRNSVESGDQDGDEGTFVWADSKDFGFPLPVSTPGFTVGPNQFLVRATGSDGSPEAVIFVTEIDTNGESVAGVWLGPGDTAWNGLSDRNLKENFVRADGCKILERLASIPIEVWNFKHQDPSLRHIGPMAQDFYAAFKVGRDQRHISTLDADGVALAAIQGLYEIVKEKDAKIAALEARLGALEEAVAGMAQGYAPRGGVQ